ncbi:MAG TPA: hypothetical protein PK659_08265 [Methanothrix sp.]|nr:hypothetical protein [Methanothrix sp.]HOL44228.1 hypothetical protein [Methanothrix sp.]
MPRGKSKKKLETGGEALKEKENVETVTVMIAMFSRAYRNLAAQQYAEGLVNHKGDLLVGNQVLKKKEAYRLPRTPEVDELIRKGVLQDIRHTIFGPKRAGA